MMGNYKQFLPYIGTCTCTTEFSTPDMYMYHITYMMYRRHLHVAVVPCTCQANYKDLQAFL